MPFGFGMVSSVGRGMGVDVLDGTKIVKGKGAVSGENVGIPLKQIGILLHRA